MVSNHIANSILDESLPSIMQLDISEGHIEIFVSPDQYVASAAAKKQSKVSARAMISGRCMRVERDYLLPSPSLLLLLQTDYKASVCATSRLILKINHDFQSILNIPAMQCKSIRILFTASATCRKGVSEWIMCVCTTYPRAPLSAWSAPHQARHQIRKEKHDLGTKAKPPAVYVSVCAATHDL